MGTIYDKLFDWQKRLVDKFKDKDRYGLFLDMGLGKTPISSGLAEANNCKRIIVITINPKTLETVDTFGSWKYWLNMIDDDITFFDKKTSDSTILNCQSSTQCLIINYESLFKRNTGKAVAVALKDSLQTFAMKCRSQNTCIIIDESHKLKDIQTKQTKAAQLLIKTINRYTSHLKVYLLTGTPFTTGYIDLYSQLKILGYEATKGQFVDKYCIKGHIPGLFEWNQPIIGYKNIDELFELVHEYAVTIQSEDVIDLPDKIFIDHTCNCTHEFNMFTTEKVEGRVIYEMFKDRGMFKPMYNVKKKVNNPFYRNIDYPNFNWLAETNGQFWLRARQLSIGFQGNEEQHKWFNLDRFKDIKRLLEEHHDNYIIFYNFTPELFQLYDLCEELDYNVDVYCGPIKSLTFYEKYCSLKPEQQLTAKNNVIIANFASGSTGMNWQAYNKCIITSLPVYKDYAQALKRIHRVGQKDTCIYHVFYQKNWLDMSMKSALEEKVDYTYEMFLADLDRVKNFTSD